MDDWASPWAEEEQYQQPTNARETGGNNTSTTTHLPVAKAATLSLGESINSPWDNVEEEDDDEGFGEWSLPAEVKLAEGSFQPDEAWHRNAGNQGELEDHAKDLAPAWKENATLSEPPKLAPSPVPKHLMRQSSPGPWATESSRNDIPHAEEKEISEEGLAELEQEGDGSLDVTSLGSSPQSGPQDVAQEHILRAHDIPTPEAESIQSTESKRNSTADVDRSSSQPSSSPSVTSQHEDGRHESPRTSMDDESHRPQLARKVSSKIQELVEHFDGLVKQGDDEVFTSRESSQVRSQEQSPHEGIEDFGEFADSKEETLGIEAVTEQNLLRTDSPDYNKHVLSPMTQPSSPRSPNTLKETTSQIHSPQKVCGPISVDVDLSILDKLFPPNKSEPAEDIFIPDSVPHDSFRSMEERKMWYRISRYGPMLKHDNGDDENYVRISWPKSTVRDDTLKIVARWMEEDRLSGHVVLGGGGKTSTLFGWGDSKAPAVSLASAFASRDIKKAQRSSIIQPTAPDMTDSTSPRSSSRQIPEKAPSISEEPKPTPPVVSFGWNSVPDTVSHRDVQISTSPGLPTTIPKLPAPQTISPTRTSTSSLRPIVLSKTIVPIESPQQTPLPVSASLSEASTDFLVSMAKPMDAIDNQEEDDDWGDMVSTPNTTTIEFIPSPIGKFREEATIRKIIPKTAPETPMAQFLGHKQDPIPEIFDNGSLEQSILPVIAEHSNVSSSLPSTGGKVWASADFSFFDSSSAPLPTPAPAPLPLKSVTFSSLPPRTLHPPKLPPSHIHPPRTTATKSRSKVGEEPDQEELVQSIIKGLPDLSYMLRK